MRLTETLVTWLKSQEWEERPEIDEERKNSSTAFGYRVGDFSLKCWFDAAEEIEVFKYYMYYLDTKVPENRVDEIYKFVSGVNTKILTGCLHFLPEERIIRYYHGIDFEGAAFEPQHITNMIAAGGGSMNRWLPKYMAVCYGGLSAEEVFKEE